MKLSVSTLLRNSTDTSVPLQSSYSVGIHVIWGFPGGSEVKASAYNVGNLGSIPGLGRDPLEKKTATPSSILAWRIPWMEPGGLQSTGSQRVDKTDLLQFSSCHFAPTCFIIIFDPVLDPARSTELLPPSLAHLNPALVFGEYL